VRRRWRNVVFGSPLRLNLQLLCTARTPVKEVLDVWPALPIHIRDEDSISGLDNITAVLEHNDRICEIVLHQVSNSLLERVSAALMQEPFPALTQLELVAHYETTPTLPSEPFRGGSAPRLREFSLDGIPIPDLPKLLLSATHLIDLTLWSIPCSGYISPEAMVTCLSALISLEQLLLEFQLPRSYPDQEIERLRPRPLTRSVLPSLILFAFRGVSEYLEDFIARIDAPRLCQLDITFVNQIVFDTSQLVHFISRTPRLKEPDEAQLDFNNSAVWITFSTPETGDLKVEILGESDWQFSSLRLAQVCSSFSPSLSTVEDLYIYQHPYSEPDWQDDEIESIIIGKFTSIYYRNESLHIRAICAAYRARTASAR
jgi:hypothetical protein